MTDPRYASSAHETGGGRKHGRAKLVWIIVGAAIAVTALLVLGALLAHEYVTGSRNTPEAQVEAYLKAVVDGDASEALELWSPNVTSAERALLQDDVFAAAENRPTEYAIGRVVQDDGTDTASIEATLTVDTKRYDVAFTLEELDEGGLFSEEWQIVEGPEQTLAVGDVTRVTEVNGVEVDLSQVPTTAAPGEGPGVPDPFPGLSVLPGDYAFTAPENTAAFAFGDDKTVTVLPGEIADPALAPNPDLVNYVPVGWTEEAKSEAISQVQARIDECMKSDQFVPALCPNTLTMDDPGYVAITGIERSWDVEPTIEFQGGSMASSVLVSGGLLRFDYQERMSEEDEWEPDSQTTTDPFDTDLLMVPVVPKDENEFEVDLSVF